MTDPLLPADVPTTAQTEASVDPTETASAHATDTAPDKAANRDTLSTTARVQAISDYLDRWIPAVLDQERQVGAQVAIRVNGELLYSKACGSANATDETPLTTDHLFHVASHSKSVASTITLLLVEDGTLRLDDTVGHWLPDLADSDAGALTLRELLGHQAGVIRDGSSADFWQLRAAFPSRAELIAAARDEEVTYEPNLWFKYSNIGFGLIGAVLEQASGQSWAELVATRITSALGDTIELYADLTDALRPRMAAGHTRVISGRERQALPPAPANGLASATGVVASAEGLTAFFSALMSEDGGLLTPRTRRLQRRLESIVTQRGKEVGRYGLGVELVDHEQRHLFGHSGGYPGFVTQTLSDPEDGLSISVLTNQAAGVARRIVVGIVSLIDLVPEKPEGHAGAVPDDVAGSYETVFGTVDLARLGDGWFLLPHGLAENAGLASSVTASEDGSLRCADQHGFAAAGEPVDILRDSTGAVEGIRLGGVSLWTPQRMESVLRDYEA